MTARRVVDNVRILRWSCTSALADLRTMYTWKTWVFAWLVRVLCQVMFFGVIGWLVGSAETTRFLVIGNAVYVGVTAAMLVVQSTSWERLTGTLPLLVASPANPFTVFAGRSAQWLLDGLAISAISLFMVGALFGIELPLPRALLFALLMPVVLGSVYSFGLLLGAIGLRMMGLRNIISSLGHSILMVWCGVQVPPTYWPAWVQRITDFLPLKHGLIAIRNLLDQRGPILRPIMLELLVGIGWLLIAMLAFRRLAEGGRKDGSIEFAE